MSRFRDMTTVGRVIFIGLAVVGVIVLLWGAVVWWQSRGDSIRRETSDLSSKGLTDLMNRSWYDARQIELSVQYARIMARWTDANGKSHGLHVVRLAETKNGPDGKAVAEVYSCATCRETFIIQRADRRFFLAGEDIIVSAVPSLGYR